MNYTTLITAVQLQSLMASGAPLMVFDCSFDLMQAQAGDQQFLERRIVGAVRANLDRHLSAQPGRGRSSGGRHPLPTPQDCSAWLASTGFHHHMQAVVYDRQGTTFCARLWWMLKWLGHDAVAVLDGGLPAWQAMGGALNSGEATPLAPGQFVAKTPRATLVTSAQVLAALGSAAQTVLDARAGPRYRGEVEPLDPIAGHIPGALNRPFGDNFQQDGRFKDRQTLHAEFSSLLGGRDPSGVVHQCGSGVTATPNMLAMELAGLGASALYAGSWSEWCSDTTRPVARGSEQA